MLQSKAGRTSKGDSVSLVDQNTEGHGYGSEIQNAPAYGPDEEDDDSDTFPYWDAEESSVLSDPREETAIIAAREYGLPMPKAPHESVMLTTGHPTPWEKRLAQNSRRTDPEQNRGNGSNGDLSKSNNGRMVPAHADVKPLICFICFTKHHTSRDCPYRAHAH